MGRGHPVQNPDAVRHRLPVSVPARGPDRDHAGKRSIQLATERLLLRGRTLSLRERGRHHLRPVRRVLLLVSEDDGAHAQRDARQVAFLAVRGRLPPDLRLDAHTRNTWNATAY